MGTSILFRMILWELSKVFLMSLIGITGILLMAGIVAEASQQGLGPGQILAAIPLLIPSTLPYTIPATTLFATCVVYGRLAADNEILAIKAAGVSLTKVVKPGLVLGLAMSACTMALYYNLIPYTHHLLRAMVYHDAEELLYSILRKHNAINYPNVSYAMFVKGVQGRKLINPTFKHRDAKGLVDVVAQAHEAELRVDLANNLLLVHMRHGSVTSDDGNQGYFENRVWELPLPEDILKQKYMRARDMTWNEIETQLGVRRQEEQAIVTEIATLTESLEQKRQKGLPPLVAEAQHLNNLPWKLRQIRSQINDLVVERLMRPALSLGCLCFILVGCPVGIWFGRSDFLSSFITSFVPIVIVYYPITLCGTNFAKNGGLGQVPLVWAANIIVGTIGAALFARLLRT